MDRRLNGASEEIGLPLVVSQRRERREWKIESDQLAELSFPGLTSCRLLACV